MTAEIRRPLARGDVVLADRYAWTAVAREIARGLDPIWAAALYRFTPRPDLILFHRQEAGRGPGPRPGDQTDVGRCGVRVRGIWRIPRTPDGGL